MKAFKVTRILFVVLTIITGLYATYALFMVWGDKLLYYNVEMGRTLSLTYKWALALFGALLLLNFVLGALARKKK